MRCRRFGQPTARHVAGGTCTASEHWPACDSRADCSVHQTERRRRASVCHPGNIIRDRRPAGFQTAGRQRAAVRERNPVVPSGRRAFAELTTAPCDGSCMRRMCMTSAPVYLEGRKTSDARIVAKSRPATVHQILAASSVFPACYLPLRRLARLPASHGVRLLGFAEAARPATAACRRRGRDSWWRDGRRRSGWCRSDDDARLVLDDLVVARPLVWADVDEDEADQQRSRGRWET
jgi:hypothetical protein